MAALTQPTRIVGYRTMAETRPTARFLWRIVSCSLMFGVFLGGCRTEPVPPGDPSPVEELDTPTAADSDDDDSKATDSNPGEERRERREHGDSPPADTPLADAKPAGEPSRLEEPTPPEPPNVEQASSRDSKEGTETESAGEPSTKLDSERVLFFTQHGPFLIEMVLSIDREPHTRALDKLVEYVQANADTDGDGIATWEEMLASPKFKYGQLGNAPVTTAEMRRNAIQTYDTTRNGKVDKEEVPRFLTRNAGGSRSFDFRSANYYREINRVDSPLRRLLDADEDGRINADEAERAETRLLSRDADGDGVLFVDELLRADTDNPSPLTRRRTSAPECASWIRANSQWINLLYSLEEQYMLGAHLQPSAFQLTPGMFDLLDADSDGRIRAKEMAGLLAIVPHLRIAAHLGDWDVDQGPRLAVQFIHPDLKSMVSCRVAGDQIHVDLPKDRLLIFYRDEARTANLAGRARVLLAQYDANNDSYLEEDEFPEENSPGLMGGIEAYDSDKDGKVYEAELTEFLENAGVAFRAQIRARGGDLTDGLFSVIDANRDGRLDGREIAAIPETIASLDENSDGELVIDEIPGSMALAITRGDPQQDEVLFAIPTAAISSNEDAPRWFRGMDRNRDGAIAAREFLGNGAQFRKLDANEDGFLTLEEILASTMEDQAKSPSEKAASETSPN